MNTAMKFWLHEMMALLVSLFGRKKEQMARGWRNCTMSFMTCTLHQIRGPLEKFVDWLQCAAGMQREA
jgi:hypothetical protein